MDNTNEIPSEEQTGRLEQTAVSYQSPHYFTPDDGKGSRFCRCGKYLTDDVHLAGIVDTLIGVTKQRTKMDEPDYKLMVSRIGAIIEDTIPEHSEINVVDAVALLVRENNALRISLGLPTYAEIAKLERDKSAS